MNEEKIDPASRALEAIWQEHQYALSKWGEGHDNKTSIAEFLIYMEQFLNYAKQRIVGEESQKKYILSDVRKIGGLCVSLMRVHGVVERDGMPTVTKAAIPAFNYPDSYDILIKTGADGIVINAKWKDYASNTAEGVFLEHPITPEQIETATHDLCYGMWKKRYLIP